jgi:hypothetical protein
LHPDGVIFKLESSRKQNFVLTVIPYFPMKKELKEEMVKKAVNGRLSCSAARKIAEKLGVSYREVGAAADELGIKIKNCQLGCF